MDKFLEFLLFCSVWNQPDRSENDPLSALELEDDEDNDEDDEE